MDFIDSHAHLDRFPDIASVISASKSAGCIAIITSGYTHEANQKALELSAKFPNFVFPCIGIAPSVAMDLSEEEFARQFDFVKSNAHKAIAIGEIGLDFHWAKTDAQIKREYSAFSAQLDFALSQKLPLVIHSRKAEKEAIDSLISASAGRVLLHYFSGTPELARKAAEAGFFFTTPPVKSSSRKRMLAEIPLDRILLESDCPYVAKTPSGAAEAASLVAEAKGISIEEALSKATENARRFFGLNL
jgi:TatD DNase family protein